MPLNKETKPSRKVALFFLFSCLFVCLLVPLSRLLPLMRWEIIYSTVSNPEIFSIYHSSGRPFYPLKLHLTIVFSTFLENIWNWSSVSSTEKDIDTRLTKAWTAIDKLSIIWKSDLTDKMKCSFFQATVVSILPYGCTTWYANKTAGEEARRQLHKNAASNIEQVLAATSYGHLPSITKTIQVRRTRHAGHCWRSRDELISDVLLWTPHIWPGKSRATSSNIHSAAMWGYGM